MVRAARWFGVLVLSAALASAAPAVAEEKGKEPANFLSPIMQKLKSRINFGGFEKDERLTLREALDRLEELFDLAFVVNEKAFKQETVEEVLNTKIVANDPLPKMRGLTLETTLRRLLARVPSASGTTYVVQDRYIEITTVQALRKEILSDSDRPLLPLVSAHLRGQLLGDALEELAEGTGFSVVLDPRSGDKVKTTVTARLTNVPLDTVVRVLADMAGLKLVRIDNVLYVTTPDNAKALQEEQNRRRQEESRMEKNDEAPRR